MSLSNSGSALDLAKQIDLMASEIARLRRLCLKVMDDRKADGASLLSQAQSDEITGSLHAAWSELERKQQYLESAFREIDQLKAQLDGVASYSVDAAHMDALTASLHDAWAEIDRKQGYLETSFAATAQLQAQLAALK